MSRTWANNGITTLTANISNAATTATVDNGAVFGAPSVSNEMTAVIRQGATREIVHITNVSGNTLTLVRGREGTTGQAFTAGATIANVVTKAFTDEVETLLASGGGSAPASSFGVFAQMAGWFARGNASDQLANIGNPNASNNGTVTARSLSDSIFGAQQRLGFVSAAAINSGAGRLLSGQGYTTATAANCQPMLIRAGFGISDAVFQSTATMFVGLNPNTVVPDPATQTTVPLVGIGCSPSDANLAVYHGNGGGSVTKVDLGANFPANTTNTHWYQVELRRAAATHTWTYRIRNATNGQVASGTLSTNVPNTTTTHSVQLCRNTLTGTAAVGIDGSFYVCAYGAAAIVE
jgi:hypothetical protein